MDQDTRKIRLTMELRAANVCGTVVLAAIERTPRQLFVPESFRDRAYEDRALPISCGQTVSQPYVVAFMTEALKCGARMKVLEIGTGSGYQAAVLSRLCRRVYTIERHRLLMLEAQERFLALDIANITTRLADGAKGWPGQAPFDRIMVTAAAPSLPQTLIDQLKPGGIMVAPVGAHGGGQKIVRVTRKDLGFKVENLLAVRFVPLMPGVATDV